MPGRVFVDTSILIYAYDIDAGPRREVASRRLVELWEAGNGTLSVQVLQEFYVNVTRKIPSPISAADARGVVRTYVPWVTSPTGPATILAASEIAERHGLSFWDALIVASAHEAGASTILTEDLQPGRRIEGVSIENPFLEA